MKDDVGDTPPLSEVLASFDAEAPLDQASTIPGSWYTDRRIEGLEKKTVFSRTWQVIGRVDQLREPGQYITADVGGEPILAVRGHDGELRAFFNVCRHHAAAVMTECEGRADRLKCPYHGWTYGLDGGLERLTEFEGVVGFDRKTNGLLPLSIATWEQNVFVHLDPHPQTSLEAFLGATLIDRVSKLGLGNLHFAGRREWTLNCNWKVFVDNYLDGGYHVPFLHKGLNSVLSFKEYTIECFDRVCLQSSPMTANTTATATAATRKGDQAAYYWLYPNLMLNWYEGYLDTNLVVPLGVDRMKVIFDFYFEDVSTDEARTKNQASMDVSAHIQDEDLAICESVQKGLGSRAYQAGRLSARREAGENLFHRLLASDLRSLVSGARRRLPRV